jgi:putative NADH-flavin reductase
MQAPRKIAVVGATGRVGHHAVDVLRERGHDVVAIARSFGVDVITGDGLANALAGVECVIDAATGPSPEQGSRRRPRHSSRPRRETSTTPASRPASNG